MVDPPRSEPLLGDPERIAALPERVGHRNADPGVANLAVRAPAAPSMAEHRRRSHHLETGGVRRDDDHRPAQVRLRVGIRDGEHDPEAGSLGARREPLVPVDHPLVPVEDGTGAQCRRVRAGDLGLRHGEERPHLAGDQRREKPLALVVRAIEMEDLGVPGVGCLAAEDELRPERPADLLVHAGIGEEAESRPTRRRRDVRRPQTGRLGTLAELGEQRVRSFVLPAQRGLRRIHVRPHELPVAGAKLEQVRREERARHRQ